MKGRRGEKVGPLRHGTGLLDSELEPPRAALARPGPAVDCLCQWYWHWEAPPPAAVFNISPSPTEAPSRSRRLIQVESSGPLRLSLASHEDTRAATEAPGISGFTVSGQVIHYHDITFGIFQRLQVAHVFRLRLSPMFSMFSLR